MRSLLFVICYLLSASAQAQSPRHVDVFGGMRTLNIVPSDKIPAPRKTVPELVNFVGGRGVIVSTNAGVVTISVAPPTVTTLEAGWVSEDDDETLISSTGGRTNVYFKVRSPTALTFTNLDEPVFARATNSSGSSNWDRYPDYAPDRMALKAAPGSQAIEYSRDMKTWRTATNALQITALCTEPMVFFRIRGKTNALEWSGSNPLNNQ